MGKDDPTPMNNQFIEFRFDKMERTLDDIFQLLKENSIEFKNHVVEDKITHEQVRTLLPLLEEKRSNAGLWAGIGGAASGVGAFLYALVTGGK